jgi:indole-3-glycerol phosphate synthase
MATRLAQIVESTRQALARTVSATDIAALGRQAERHQPRGFRKALESRAGQGIAIISELKKASPSRGLIRANFSVEQLAPELEAAGAAALSVLTDQEYFQGALQNLCAASEKTRLPCLRKDFIIDEFQLLEARANRADAILLIVAALPQPDLVRLAARAKELELDVLCEVHDQRELTLAVDADCDMIGVNSRDLRTFEVDLDTTIRLGGQIPANVLRVAESGIRSGSDIARLRAAGYDAFLIGESLMAAASAGDALRKLLEEARVCCSLLRKL